MDASMFKPRKDQKRAIHRWNKYVLGQAYIRDAARLCPSTKQ
jgi:arginine-tRNA-protein transferase